MIRARNLTKVFLAKGRRKAAPRIALNALNCEIPKGSVTAIFGQNGSGKSTLLSLLAAQTTSFDGQLTISGTVPEDYVKKIPVSFASEQSDFPAHFTVDQLLRYTARLRNLSTKDTTDMRFRYCNQLGLSSVLNTNFGRLSKGIKQRVNLVQSLLCNSQYIFWDEPTSGLDWISSQNVWELITQLKTEGKTLVFSSHDLAMIGTVADKILHLHDANTRYFGKYANWKKKLEETADPCEQALANSVLLNP